MSLCVSFYYGRKGRLHGHNTSTTLRCPPPAPSSRPPIHFKNSATKVIKVSSAFGGATIPKYCDMGQAPDGSDQRADCGNDPYQIDPDKSAYVDRGGTVGGQWEDSGRTVDQHYSVLSSWRYVLPRLFRFIGLIGLLRGSACRWVCMSRSTSQGPALDTQVIASMVH